MAMGGGHRSGAAHLTEVLASCHDFLVDDCGREVGVVEGVDVDPDSAAPERLRVVQGWGRRRTTISIDEVIEVTPGDGGWSSLAATDTTCRRPGHHVRNMEASQYGGGVRSLMAQLVRRRTERGQHRGIRNAKYW